jgi:DMSO/TMAO reductase YedYZ heme-binding membrane subunit
MVVLVGTTWGGGYLSRAAWRKVHYIAYPCYVAALVHALTAGSDTEHWPTHVFYSATVGALLGALILRFAGTDWVTREPPAREHHS